MIVKGSFAIKSHLDVILLSLSYQRNFVSGYTAKEDWRIDQSKCYNIKNTKEEVDFFKQFLVDFCCLYVVCLLDFYVSCLGFIYIMVSFLAWKEYSLLFCNFYWLNYSVNLLQINLTKQSILYKGCSKTKT